MEATNLFDNNMISEWRSSNAPSGWVIVNFGAPTTLGRFRAAAPLVPYLVAAKDLALQTAPGLAGPWTDVADVTLAYHGGSYGQPPPFQSFDFTPVTAQYWRVLIKDNYGNVGVVNLAEVGFYGCK